jgi:CHASE3 domain sensor protein
MPDAADPKQPAYDALTRLLQTSSDAANNPANTPAAQELAYQVRSATSAQLDALDLAVFTGDTVDLQAASAKMTPGMDQLKALKAQIEGISQDLKEFASIVSGIDEAVGELSHLLT